MAGELLDVGVLVYLTDRVSRDLAAITRGFSTSDAAVLRMQASIQKLEASHALLGNRLLAQQQIETRNISLMQQRLALMRTTATSQSDLLRIKQLEAQITNRTAMQAITNAETENRLLQMRNDLNVRNLALTQAQARASREALVQRAQRGIMGGAMLTGVGAAGLYGIGRLASAGFDVERAQTQLRLAGNFSAAQAAAMSQQALGISQKLGLIGYQQEIEIMTALFQTLAPRLAQEMTLPLSQAADEVALMKRGEAVPSAAQLAQIANMLGAKTAADATTVASAMLQVLRGGGPTIDMARLADWATYVAPTVPGRDVGARARNLEELGLFSARFGGLTGGLSGRNIRELMLTMSHPANARQLMASQFLQQYGLARNVDDRTVENIVRAIIRAEHANEKGLFNVTDFMMGRQQLVAMFHQIDQAGVQAFTDINEQVQHGLTISQAWDVVMGNSFAQWDSLKNQVDSTAKLIGSQLDPSLQGVLKHMNTWTQQLQGVIQRHPGEVTRQIEALAGVFATLAVAGVGAAIVALGMFVTGLGALPIVAIIAGVTALWELLTHIGQVSDYISKHASLSSVAADLGVRAALAIAGPPAATVPNLSHGVAHGAIDRTTNITVHVHGNVDSPKTVHDLANQFRRALTAAPSGSGIAESPLLHGASQP